MSNSDTVTPRARTEESFTAVNNVFSFTPGQLNKLLNSKSRALGGLAGLEKGLQTAAQTAASDVIEKSHRDKMNHGSKIPTGELLGERFEIGEYLGGDNHADKYAVRDCNQTAETGSSVRRLEARAYDLQGISPEYKQYRLRSMKRLRLSSRAVLETKWRELLVIVYRTGDLQETMSPQAVEETAAAKSEAASKAKQPSIVYTDQPSSKAKSKTNYQRESARLRQRDRRQRKRQRDKQLRTESNPRNPALYNSSDVGKGTAEDGEIDEDTYSMFVILHLAHSTRPELRQLLPAESRSVVEEYLRRKEKKVTFETSNDMEEFIKVKERETVFMRRQLKKLPVYRNRYHDQLGELLNVQRRFSKYSREWVEMQDGQIEHAKHRLFKVLPTAARVLPELIAEAEKAQRVLRRNLVLERQVEADLERHGALTSKRRELSRKVSNLQMWIHHVLPSSATYAQLHSELEVARQDLENLTQTEKGAK